jgi:hypothetical protein
MDDTERLKQVALLLLNNLRGAEFDLLIYKTVLHAMAGPNGGSRLEALLREARKDPALRKVVVERYDRMEKGLQQFGKKDADKALLGALKAWKPTDPIN